MTALEATVWMRSSGNYPLYLILTWGVGLVIFSLRVWLFVGFLLLLLWTSVAEIRKDYTTLTNRAVVLDMDIRLDICIHLSMGSLYIILYVNLQREEGESWPRISAEVDFLSMLFLYLYRQVAIISCVFV